MPRLRTTLAVALLALLLQPFGRAEAGGPTSVLLTVPGEGVTASLYYTEPEYDALAHLVGVDAGPGVGSVDRSGQEHDRGPGIRVTWLIHDVTPWRVDHVYLEGDGAPWIGTQAVTQDGDNLWDQPVVWHQPEDPRALTALLAELGVAEASLAAGPFTGVPGAELPAPAEAAEESSDAAAASPPAGDDSTAFWWGVAGLLVGSLLTGAWVRVRRRGGEGEPVGEPVIAGADHLV